MILCGSLCIFSGNVLVLVLVLESDGTVLLASINMIAYLSVLLFCTELQPAVKV